MSKDYPLLRLSEIFADAGQVVFATVIIPYAIDKPSPIVVSLGTTVAVVFWAISMLLVKSMRL